MTAQLKRDLGLFSCTMLVIGNIIGVGIFTTPGEIAQGLPSAGWVLVAWLVGGFMATTGALTYAEMGAMFPKAGGNYVFLKEAYGPLVAFLYGWAYTLVTSSGTIALLAIGFAEYLGMPTGGLHSKIFSVTVVFILTAMNARDLKLGASVMDAITGTKVVVMLFLVIVGFAIGNGQTANFHPLFTGEPVGIFSAIAAALVPMAFTYSGWNSTVIVAEEVREPERLIPISLILGTLGTTVIYMLMNAVYLYAVPLGQLVGEVKIAHLAAANLFGQGTTRLITALVATSVLGCLSATLLTNPRTTFALGRDGLFFRFTGNVHPKFQTPTGAIWFQGLWACVLICLGDFEKILQVLSVPLVIIATMTVIAIFIFRKKFPDVHRPYKCWGYPVIPIVYIGISLAMLVVKFNQRSQQYLTFETFKIGIPMSYLGLGIFILGIPVYYLWRRFYPKAQ
jgi:APA family basic amino acid/polyamine antiporter